MTEIAHQSRHISQLKGCTFFGVLRKQAAIFAPRWAQKVRTNQNNWPGKARIIPVQTRLAVLLARFRPTIWCSEVTV
jgi:hypothetical protein